MSAININMNTGDTSSRADLKRPSMSSEGFHIRGTPSSSYLNRSSKLSLARADMSFTDLEAVEGDV